MKLAIAASVLVHVGGLALVPGSEPRPPEDAAAVARECRCDYEMTITDARPPRSLTLGVAPDGRFER